MPGFAIYPQSDYRMFTGARQIWRHRNNWESLMSDLRIEMPPAPLPKQDPALWKAAQGLESAYLSEIFPCPITKL